MKNCETKRAISETYDREKKIEEGEWNLRNSNNKYTN